MGREYAEPPLELQDFISLIWTGETKQRFCSVDGPHTYGPLFGCAVFRQ